MKPDRIFVTNDGKFAIDLAQVVAVSHYYDEALCEKCQQDHPIARLTVYTSAYMNQDDNGFCLSAESGAALIAAWVAYHRGGAQ